MIDLPKYLHELNTALSETEQGFLRKITDLNAELRDLGQEVLALQSENQRLCEQLDNLRQENIGQTSDLKVLGDEKEQLILELQSIARDRGEVHRRLIKHIEDSASADRASDQQLHALSTQIEAQKVMFSDVGRRQDEMLQAFGVKQQYEIGKFDYLRAETEKREARYLNQLEAFEKENRELRVQVAQRASDRAVFESETGRLQFTNQELVAAAEKWRAEANAQRLLAASSAQTLRAERGVLLDVIPEFEGGISKICRTPTDQLLIVDLLRRTLAQALDSSTSSQVAADLHDEGNKLQ